MLIPVILSGGAGTRLWPVSREAHPKPFMRLPDGRSLLQHTLERSAALAGVQRVLTVTNRDYYFQTRDEYTALPAARGLGLDFLLEPSGRNTAPAIAAATLWAQQQVGDDAVLMVMPADHVIEDTAAFGEAVAAAQGLAQQGHLVTFGIRPTQPETGYGYIEQGEQVQGAAPSAFHVQRFVEKPDLQTAREYLESGRFLWNAGMFCFRVAAMLEALEAYAPEVMQAARTCWEATDAAIEPVALDTDTFVQCPSISIDYAVMEKARDAAVVACGFDWSDVGSWDSVSALTAPDEAGNRIIGETISVDSRDCYVHSEDRLVAALGVENLIIVDTPDALLVAAART